MTSITTSYVVGPTLILNLFACFLYKTCLFRVAFRFGPLHRNPVNALIVFDETIKMIVLFGQSAMVYTLLAGGALHEVYGEVCQLLLLSSTAAVCISYFGGESLNTAL